MEAEGLLGSPELRRKRHSPRTSGMLGLCRGPHTTTAIPCHYLWVRVSALDSDKQFEILLGGSGDLVTVDGGNLAVPERSIESQCPPPPFHFGSNVA